MNNQKTVNIRGAFGAEAVRILRGVPGLGVVAEPSPPEYGGDAVVRCAENRMPISVEYKGRVNAAAAWQLVRLATVRPEVPLLLVAGQTTRKAREILEVHGIALVDGQGYAHIELPGLFYHLEGRRRAGTGAEKTPPSRLRGKAGLVAQALLLQPERAWQVKELAEVAEVSAGLAHRILARLEGEQVVASEGAGPNRVRRVTNATALLDLWAEENVDRATRTPAYLLAQTPRLLIEELGGRLGRSGVDYALTGAAAGSLVAPLIGAIPVVEVWVQATAAVEELCEAAGADRVADGENVVFLQAGDDAPLAYSEQVDVLWVVNRFRLYLDLCRDPRRGREQADHLRSEVIGF